MNNKYSIFLVLGILLIMGIGFVSSADSYRLNSGNTVIISEWGVAKKVTNNLASDIFIPTRSSTEWASFRANTPTNVAVVDGCLTGSDCAVDAYCYAVTNACSSALPTCTEPNLVGTGFTYQSSNEDRWNECSTVGCGTGYCAGGIASCGEYTDGLQHNCAVGYVCSSTGTCVLDSTGCTFDSDCGFREYCDARGRCIDCSISDLCRIDEQWDPIRCECVLCFTGETQVLMADGTYKRIDEVQVGEIIEGGLTKNKVKNIQIHDFNGDLYSINGGDYFVTAEHPFRSLEGWKSIIPYKLLEEDPYLYELLKPTKMKIGDILIMEDGLVIVESINSKKADGEIKVYNLNVDGDDTYYANGYLVHNPELKEPL